jgi:hypothetical protein
MVIVFSWDPSENQKFGQLAAVEKEAKAVYTR